MKLINKNSYISTPYRMRCLVKDVTIDTHLHSFNIETLGDYTGNITVITEDQTESKYYKINNLKVSAEVEVYIWRDSFMWVTADKVKPTDCLFTDHGSIVPIETIEISNSDLIGRKITTDDNFYAGGYLVK
jgi:hypothetical protein